MALHAKGGKPGQRGEIKIGRNGSYAQGGNVGDYNPYDPEQSSAEPAKSVDRIAAIDTFVAIIGTLLVLAGVLLYLVVTS